MRSLIAALTRKYFPSRAFSSTKYWKERYEGGGNSGPGSYGKLAGFKADVLNRFVQESAIQSVVEFGCGDGSQLALARYPRYTGYDISAEAVGVCREMFRDDASKEFFLAQDYDGRRADLAMSLDVVFHLTEDHVFESYMRRLFAASDRYVIIYSSNQDEPFEPVAPHVRHRNFTRWIEREMPGWSQVAKIPNAFPYDGDYRSTSFCDFYIHAREDAAGAAA